MPLAMFGQCDVDGSGKIEFREFMKLFRKIFVVARVLRRFHADVFLRIK